MTVDEAREFLFSISYKLGNMGVEYLSEKDGEKMRKAINTLDRQASKKGTRYVKQLKPVVISHGGMGFRDEILPLGDFDWVDEDDVCKDLWYDKFKELYPDGSGWNSFDIQERFVEITSH